ncbi:hypothetical protein L7F22_012437 [Adiantum nelumboides]|nr:hypothetical protein [Adiantum nelumboides]
MAKGEDEAWLSVLRYGSLLSFPVAVDAALKLNIFEILKNNGALSAQAMLKLLASPATNPNASSMLDRVLRLLSTETLNSLALLQATDAEDEECGVDAVNEDDNGVTDRGMKEKKKTLRYSLLPSTQYFLKDSRGISPGEWYMKTFISRVPAFTCLDRVILEGGSGSNLAFGHVASEHVAQHSHKLSGVMESITSVFMRQFLHLYDGLKDVADGGCLVDVGGCTGFTLMLILDRYEHLHGINYDQPHIIANAPQHPRLKHVGGNMLESVPQGDMIFMKLILHDWEDDQCIKILRNCKNAISREHGKLVMAEYPVSDSIQDPVLSLQVDVLMLGSHGDKVRSAEDYQRLGLAAGFHNVEVACIVNEYTVIEFIK